MNWDTHWSAGYTVSGPSKSSCFPSAALARWERPAKPQGGILDRLGRSLRERTGSPAFIFGTYYFFSTGRSISTPSTSRQTRTAVDRIALGNLILAALICYRRFPWMAAACLRALLSRMRSELKPRESPPGRDACWPSAWTLRTGLSAAAGLRGILLYLGAANEGAASRGRLLTLGIPVRAAMARKYHTLSHGNTIRDAANLLLSTSQQDFPVVHGDQVVGLLGRLHCSAGWRPRDRIRYVAGSWIANFRASRRIAISPKFFLLLARSGACALVMQDGQLLGRSRPRISRNFSCCAALACNRWKDDYDATFSDRFLGVLLICRRLRFRGHAQTLS